MLNSLVTVILNKAWNWRYARSDDLVTFSISSAWDQIRPRRPTINWWKIVWFAKAIPRHAFVTWLALSDRLSANERIVSWVISCDILCVLCRACTTNRDHIFFKCPYTQRSWRIIKRWFCQEGLDDEWGNLITWAVQNRKEKSLGQIVAG